MEWEWVWRALGFIGGLVAVAFGLVKMIYSGLEKELAEVKGEMRGLSENVHMTREGIHELRNRVAGDYVTRVENDRKFAEVSNTLVRFELKLDKLLERKT